MENNSSIGNRKRVRSMSSPNAVKNESLNIEPPNKRQKISKSNRTKIDKNHFLHDIKSNPVTINRTYDLVRFDDDEDDDYDESNDKTRKLKFNIYKVNNNDNIYIPLTDFYKIFKYSSSSIPKSKEITKLFLEHINDNLNKQYGFNNLLKKNELITKYNGKLYISKAGFCIFIIFLSMIDESNKYVQHFIYYRYYYLKHLFNNKSSISIKIKKPRSIDESLICPACCLDVIIDEYVDNPCDCQVLLHLNCTKLGLKTEDIPDDNNKAKDNDWFCPFCINYTSIDNLKKRRLDQLENDNGYEIETIVDYRYSDNNYLVKWKGYPHAANMWQELSSTFVEAAEQYWQNKGISTIPMKAQAAIDEIKNDNNAITKTMEDISLEIDDNKNTDKNTENEEDEEDVEMKSEIAEPSENTVFIPVKLGDIMDPNLIIRRQKYTKETYTKRKEIIDKYKKKLQQEVIKGSRLGQEIKYEMDGDKLPKYHLQCINDNWNSSLPRIRDIIKAFLSRNWNKWDHDVSQKSFVIGEIIDPENPAKKYGSDQGVHEHKAYGLFSTDTIKKDTLLFEYAGCVKEIGQASKKLDHLETELDQTTLFDLIGHLDKKNRNKLYWGKKPNEQLVIDPSKWHNEGVYMNDFRTNVMTDPDDDPEINSDQEDDDIDNSDNGDNNNNQGRKQNVKFYEVLVNNWPRVFAVAICDIPPNEELLGDYGCDFWANFRLMMRRRAQLDEIKARINNEWEMKYDALQTENEELKSQIEKLRKSS